jgi:hypothetical protein
LNLNLQRLAERFPSHYIKVLGVDPITM